MFPQGFHPIVQTRLPDVSGRAPVLSRSAVPVKYYYIDFGISTRFTSDAPRLVVGTLGLDEEPPELSDSIPYDPFKLDVFMIGNLIRRSLYDVRVSLNFRRPLNLSEQKFSNLTMLEPLMNQMSHEDPARRPSAAEAHQQFKVIRRNVPTLYRHWDLQPRDSFLLVRVFRQMYSLVRNIFSHYKSRLTASAQFCAIYRSIF